MLIRLRALLSRFNPDTILATGILVATTMLLFLVSYGWHTYQHHSSNTASPAEYHHHSRPPSGQLVPAQLARPSAAAGKLQ